MDAQAPVCATLPRCVCVCVSPSGTSALLANLAVLVLQHTSVTGRAYLTFYEGPRLCATTPPLPVGYYGVCVQAANSNGAGPMSACEEVEVTRVLTPHKRQVRQLRRRVRRCTHLLAQAILAALPAAVVPLELAAHGGGGDHSGTTTKPGQARRGRKSRKKKKRNQRHQHSNNHRKPQLTVRAQHKLTIAAVQAWSTASAGAVDVHYEYV